MSGLYGSNDVMYARYKQGELDSDLNVCLRANNSEQGSRVSRAALNAHSAELGRLADVAVKCDNGVLFINDLSPSQLDNLAAALYGKSLKDTCSLEDIQAFSHFGSDLAFSGMETALIEILKCKAVAGKERLPALYSIIPSDYLCLQDAAFECIMKYSQTKPFARVILPRHVNLWLEELRYRPTGMLPVLMTIYESHIKVMQTAAWFLTVSHSITARILLQETSQKQKDMLDTMIHVPADSWGKRITVACPTYNYNTTCVIVGRHVHHQAWMNFSKKLKPSNFQQGVQSFCDILMLTSRIGEVDAERKKRVEAQTPKKHKTGHDLQAGSATC